MINQIILILNMIGKKFKGEIDNCSLYLEPKYLLFLL